MNHQAFRLARRFSAALDPAKLEALLLKIRKSEGKITTLTWSNIGDILSMLDPGWKLEKHIGIVKLYGRHRDKPESFFDEKEAEVERRHKLLEKSAVTSLPSSPKPNELYVLELTPVTPKANDFEFQFKPWMGAEGWKITASNGKVIEILPEVYDFGEYYHGYKEVKRTKIATYRWLPVLNKETDWLAQIDKKLGLGAFEKTAPRTREKTGSCPVCFANIKITEGDQKIVLHGYLRPGTGATHGSCEGVGYPAFELSVEGTEAYLKGTVQSQYTKGLKLQAKLSSPDINLLSYGSVVNPQTVQKGDPQWDYHLKRAQKEAEQFLKDATSNLEAYTKLVKNWKLRSLPKEGDKHIDWFYKGQTD